MPLHHSVENLAVELANAALVETICKICQKPLGEANAINRVFSTPCEHRFHENCINDWVEQFKECQECKKLVHIRDLKQVIVPPDTPEPLVQTGSVPKVHNTRHQSKKNSNSQPQPEAGIGDLDQVDNQPPRNRNRKVGRPARNRNVTQNEQRVSIGSSYRNEQEAVDYNRIFTQIEQIVSRQIANLSLHNHSGDFSDRANITRNSMGSSDNTRGRSQINPEKITQLIHRWNVKFDGSMKGDTVEEFIYRIQTLTEDCLDNDFEAVCKNLHILLVGKAREWYWRYRKEFPRIVWEEFCAALKYQYKDYRKDSEILEDIRGRKQKPGESFETFYDEIMILSSRMSASIPEEQLIEMLSRNLLPDIRHELLYVPIHSIAHLRKLVQMRENLLGDVSAKRSIRNQGNQPFAKRNIAALEDSVSSSEVDPNQVVIEAIQAPIKVFRCWNCDTEGHGWDMCLQERRRFCYGCGAKNVYKPQCTVCLSRKSENLKKGPFNSNGRMAPKTQQ